MRSISRRLLAEVRLDSLAGEMDNLGTDVRAVQDRSFPDRRDDTMEKRLLVVVALLTFAGVAAETAGAAPSMCVAANGEVRHKSGTATCNAAGKGSVAIAKGDFTNAYAGIAVEGDDRNKAKAFGDSSNAAAFGGDGNTATVRGDNSQAYAGDGDGNTAAIRGDNSQAFALTGDGNTATIDGDDSLAFAEVGDRNTSTVHGDGSGALAGFGSDNTAIASGDGCTADAFEGDGLTATCP
jgi:hypothetical protein